MVAGDIDLVIVPGVAFDRHGYRLGRGGGHYDAWLVQVKAPRLGLAFAVQIVEAVPGADYDQTVDWIVTEREVINCEGRK